VTETRLETLRERLEALDVQYKQAVSTVTRNVFETSLPSCLDCPKVLYPRAQWQKIPAAIRETLHKWLAEAGSYNRCATCYRAAVRAGTISTVRKFNQQILSEEELLLLRKQVGVIK
jgi:hypothetical protein